MIYMVTGSPGVGKTAFVVKMIMQNAYSLFKNQDEYRPIYTLNITWKDGHGLPVIPIDPEDFIKAPLHENFEQGSVIIVDEASEIYPSRVLSSKLPTHIEGLNKLRHYGFTLILITQFPHLVDPFVRHLVGKHLHVERKQVGERLYEWNSCQTQFSPSTFALAYSESYKPDPITFDKYVSAFKHVEFKSKKSWVWYLFIICPILLLFFLWLFYYYLDDFSADQNLQQSPSTIQKSVESVDSARSAVENLSLTPLDDILKPPEAESQTDASKNLKETDFVPTIEGRLESAPIYNNVRQVVDFPQIVGCVETRTTCNCYTQQATIALAGKQCRDYRKSPEFNPYRRRFEDRNIANNPQQPKTQDEPLVLTFGK